MLRSITVSAGDSRPAKGALSLMFLRLRVQCNTTNYHISLPTWPLMYCRVLQSNQSRSLLARLENRH